MDSTQISPVLEIAATMSIAFVAVEISKTYTYALYKNFFRYDDKITKEFNVAQKDLIDEESLKNLPAINCGNNNTSKIIEKIRRDREQVVRQSKEKQEKLYKEAEIICLSRSHSNLCLYNFLYCICVILSLPFYDNHKIVCGAFMTLLCGVSFIYNIIGWLKGESSNQWKWLDYTSVISPIIVFAITSVISFVSSFFLQLTFIKYWGVVFILVAIMPYINFCAFAFIIKVRLSRFNKKLTSEKQDIKDKCSLIKSQVEGILQVEKIANFQTEIDA